MAIPQDFFHIFKVGLTLTDNLAITWSRNERVNEAMAFPVGEKLLYVLKVHILISSVDSKY